MTTRCIVAATGTAMLALVLAGCSTVNADCKDMRVGECKVQAARFMTDTTMSVDGLGGAGVNYSSSPNAQAMTDTMKALTDALALALARGGQSVSLPPPGSEFEGSRGVPPMLQMKPVPPLCPAMGPVARVTPSSVYIERVVETKDGPLALYEGI
jgi:hypothetical protein